MLAVGIGGAVVSGAIGAAASESAASTEANAATNASNNTLEATRESNNLQQGFFNQNQQNESPFLASGQTALAALNAGMGLGNPYATQPVTPNANGVTPGAVTNPSQAGNGPTQGVTNGPSSTTTGNGTFTSSTGALVDANGNPIAQTPTTTNYGATNDALNTAAQSQIGANGQGNFTQTFTPSSLALDPSYQFRLNQGQQQLNASAAATGLAGSGQNLKDITNYGQGAASQEYQAAYDRFMQNQNTQVSRLQSLAGVGQDAAAQVGNAATATGGAIANTTMSGAAASNNYLTGAAAAGAAGTVGAANAFTSGIGNTTNNWMQQQLIGKMFPGTAPPPPAPEQATIPPYTGGQGGNGVLIPGDADGGRIEPQIGTYSPVRTGGAGGLSPAAIRAAMAASSPASGASKSGIGLLRVNPVTNPKGNTDQQLSDAEALALQPDPPASVPAQADGGAVGATGPEMTSGTGQQQENEMVNGPQGFMSWLYHGMPKGNERNERAIYQMLNSYTPMPNKSVLAPAPTWAGAASAAPSPLTPAKSSTDYLPDDIYKRMSGYLPAPSASQAASAPQMHKGGKVTGKGGPRSDNQLRWLSSGEYVLNTKTVNKIGGGSNKAGADKLDKINNPNRKK